MGAAAEDVLTDGQRTARMKGACGEGRCPLRACEGSTACVLKCLIWGGAHAPLRGFMGSRDAGAPTLLRVVRDGCVWPLALDGLLGVVCD